MASKTDYVSAVKQAFINAGFSENQANILTAEVGREGSFNPNLLFGSHTDPHNKKTNFGFLSWQGPRRDEAMAYLKSQGVYKNGRIEQSQAALDAMARFVAIEMKRHYSKTTKPFLDNPNISYADGARIVGADYIGWRYTDPNYARGHSNRDYWYKRVSGIEAQAVPLQYNQAGTSQVAQIPVPELPKAPQAPQFDYNNPMAMVDNIVGSILPQGVNLKFSDNAAAMAPSLTQLNANNLFSPMTPPAQDPNAPQLTAPTVQSLFSFKG